MNFFFYIYRNFIPQNNLPLGIEVWRDRLFVSMPRWKQGVPATLATLPLPADEKNRSPPMMPYPSWSDQSSVNNPDCSKLMSVYRMHIDECERLWVIDSGIVNATILPNQICPPKIVAFDLKTDRIVVNYELPPEQVKQDSFHTNILVDIRENKCDDAFVYVPDVWRYGLVVFSLKEDRSWRTINHLYLPNPRASDYTLHGLNFQWTDGIFGIALSPIDRYNDRTLFFHPMSGFNEFTVLTSILRNESLWQSGYFERPNAFTPIGTRGSRGQASSSAMASNNVMFFNLIHQDAVGCWDINKPYNVENLGIVERNTTTLIFPNDIVVDHEREQGVWVISNRLPVYLYAQLNFNDINFRIQRVNVRDAVLGTPCDPLVPPFPPKPTGLLCDTHIIV